MPSASPSMAGLGLPYMPLDAAIGRVFTPYCPSGRHGHQFQRKKSSCGVVNCFSKLAFKRHETDHLLSSSKLLYVSRGNWQDLATNLAASTTSAYSSSGVSQGHKSLTSATLSVGLTTRPHWPSPSVLVAVSWTVTVHVPMDRALLKFISLLSCLGSLGCGSEASMTKDLVDALTCVFLVLCCESGSQA